MVVVVLWKCYKTTEEEWIVILAGSVIGIGNEKCASLAKALPRVEVLGSVNTVVKHGMVG